MEHFDLIIIGSGPGGSTLASICNKEGMKVAVADSQFGGTCSQRGCTPKKAMETLSSMWWKAQHLSEFGFPQVTKPLIWRDLLSQIQTFTALVPPDTIEQFRQAGIYTIEGEVSFVDANTLTIDGTNQSWTADSIVIASGSSPVDLNIPGAEHLFSHEAIFEIPELPKRIVFVGGGYIGFELAHITSACGSEVSIISRDEMPLGDFDHELTDKLVSATVDKSIGLHLGYDATQIEALSDGYRVTIENRRDGRQFRIDADCVIHSAGRKPNVEALQLQNAELELSEDGMMIVNDNLCCAGSKHIYAIGDVTGEAPYTPAAEYDAKLVAHNLTNRRQKRVNYHGMPKVLYTYPKLAAVGQLRKELDEQGLEYECHEGELASDLIEKSEHNTFNGYCIFVDAEEKTILGAHVLSSRAEEIVNIFAMAMQMDMESEELKELIMAYPSATQAVKYMV